jgi:hypothetical protein
MPSFVTPTDPLPTLEELVLLPASKGVSNESLWSLRRLLKNQKRNAIIPIRAIPPTTPPTTGPGATRGFDDTPAEADTCAGWVGFEAAVGGGKLVGPVPVGKAFGSLSVVADG